MAAFFYNENGQRRGPVDASELKKLASDGVITPETIIEFNGQTTAAKNVKGLDFHAAPPVPVPDAEPSPFTSAASDPTDAAPPTSGLYYRNPGGAWTGPCAITLLPTLFDSRVIRPDAQIAEGGTVYDAELFRITRLTPLVVPAAAPPAAKATRKKRGTAELRKIAEKNDFAATFWRIVLYFIRVLAVVCFCCGFALLVDDGGPILLLVAVLLFGVGEWFGAYSWLIANVAESEHVICDAAEFQAQTAANSAETVALLKELTKKS